MNQQHRFAKNHFQVTRRYFLQLGAAGFAGLSSTRLWADHVAAESVLGKAIAQLEYLTSDNQFDTVGRGHPVPHTLSPEKRRAAGLERDTWKLEVVPDPNSNAQMDQPLSNALGTALDWHQLMALAKKHSVRYLQIMTCLNKAEPLGMGLWEGVPLRHLIWLTRPTGNIRRVFFHGYHNKDPKQLFQSSLSINRVLEDPPGEPPVILCYKLNGEWLSPARGGPVRMVVPGAYGFKHIKWLQRVTLTNDYRANDTYALKNNDIDSPLKTFARFIHVPEKVQPGAPIPVTGLAQVGSLGLEKVQYCVQPQGAQLPADDPYFTQAEWKDAKILPLPQDWDDVLPGGQHLLNAPQFSASKNRSLRWPMPYTIAHWAVLVPGLASGQYDLRCRTIDTSDNAQPMPRPFRKSGRNAIQTLALHVES